MTVAAVLELLNNLAKLGVTQIPGFDERQQLRAGELKVMYAEEMGKPIDSIDAAKLDSIELELRNILQLLNSSILAANHSPKPASTG